MRRIVVLAAAALAITGCQTNSIRPTAPSENLQQLESQYNAANQRYQSACFPGDSSASVSAALHGSHAQPAAPHQLAIDSSACKAAKADLDVYERPYRAAVNAQLAR
jgi:hypothetical protein